MLTGLLVVCALAVLGVLLVAAIATKSWLQDRRESRAMLLAATLHSGPDGARACGDAWATIRNDRPPALLLRTTRATLSAGTPASDTEPPAPETTPIYGRPAG